MIVLLSPAKTLDYTKEFEVKIGSFEGAINPKTKSFTDFKSFVQKN